MVVARGTGGDFGVAKYGGRSRMKMDVSKVFLF